METQLAAVAISCVQGKHAPLFTYGIVNTDKAQLTTSMRSLAQAVRGL